MTSGTPRAYTNALVRTGNISRSVVRFKCFKCATELEIANNNPRHHGKYFAAQARKKGWEADPERINRVFCEDCRSSPGYRTRRQRELDSVMVPALDEPMIIIDGYAEPVPDLPPPPPKPPAKVLPQPAKAPPTPAEQKPWIEAAVVAIAATQKKEVIAMPQSDETLTQPQRLQIRSYLDKYFDDQEGFYLADDAGVVMSDQTIGAAVGVPWGEVTKLREAAYGKIMVDPAIAALRTQLAALQQQAAEQFASLQKQLEAMQVELNGYATRKRA